MIRPHKEHRHTKSLGSVGTYSEYDNQASNHRYNYNHGHTPGDRKPHEHDLAMSGVMLHVLSDAINNIGVIIAALVIWLAKYETRYYADPGVSMGISIMILLSCLPLSKLPFTSADLQLLIHSNSKTKWHHAYGKCSRKRADRRR
jgi:Co/Zn/Cd efflux system component